MVAPPRYIESMKDRKPAPPNPEQLEELPDAWERFEKAFDTVMKAKPKPRAAKPKERPATNSRSHNRAIAQESVGAKSAGVEAPVI